MMTSQYHCCYVCDVDLLPAPCACHDSDVFAYRCAAEDRNVCDERASIDEIIDNEEINWHDYESEDK